MGGFGHTSEGDCRNAIEMQWKIRHHAEKILYLNFLMESLAILYLLVLGANIAICSDNEISNGSIKQEEDAGARAKAKFNEYKVKVYTLDDSGNKKALDETGYEVKPYFYGFYVEFKDEAKCVELEVKGKTMWEKGNKEGHPLRAYFDLTLRVCIVEFDTIFKGYTLIAISPFCLKTEKDPFVPSDFKFFGLGKENGTGTSLVSTQNGTGVTTQTGTDTSTNLVEFVAQGTSTGSPEYELRDYGHSHTFMFNPLDRCTEIKYKEQVLWKHDSSEFGTSYPIQFSVMKFWKKANVFFPGYAFILEHKFENDQWKFNKRKELKKLEVDKFTFKTTKTDGSDCSDAKDRYTETMGAKKEYEIKANDGFVFFEVNYNNNKVWNYDDMCGSGSSSSSSSSSGSACRSRPTLVFAKLNESYLAIYLAADDFLTYHFADDKWTLSFDKDKIVNGNGNDNSSNVNGNN